MKSAKKTVNVHEAKTHLSRLLARVEAGEEVTIAKAGRPVARLVPITDTTWKRPLGMDKGSDFFIADDFDAPDPDIIALFEGPDDPEGRK